jgi:hypothetical protein
MLGSATRYRYHIALYLETYLNKGCLSRKSGAKYQELVQREREVKRSIVSGYKSSTYNRLRLVSAWRWRLIILSLSICFAEVFFQ